MTDLPMNTLMATIIHSTKTVAPRPIPAARRKSSRQRALEIARLFESVAEQIQQTTEHLRDERNIVHAWPTTTMSDGGSRGTDWTTQPEAGVIIVDTIEANLRQIEYDLDGIESYARSILRIIHHTLGLRVPELDNPRCWAGELAGYELAIVDGGWSDPTCTGMPRRGDTGPCDRCYMRHIRWRSRKGLPPLKSIHPAA